MYHRKLFPGKRHAQFFNRAGHVNSESLTLWKLFGFFCECVNISNKLRNKVIRQRSKDLRHTNVTLRINKLKWQAAGHI